MSTEGVPSESDNNGGSGYQGFDSINRNIIWGVSCGVVSTIIMKATEAWTCRSTKRNPQNEQIMPTINYIVPSNCRTCTNAQSSSQTNKASGGSSPVRKNSKENTVAAPPRVIGNNVPCKQLLDMLADGNDYDFQSRGPSTRLYLDLLQKCSNQELSVVAPTELLLKSYVGCYQVALIAEQKLCRRKYAKYLDDISTSN